MLVLTISTVHAQNVDSFSNESKILPVGIYFDITIPPFIQQINNNAPLIFSGGATYMDFGVGVSLLNDILKAQINYGFLTQDIYESMGGDPIMGLRYGGNVLGLKFMAGPEFNLGDILGSNWNWISATFNLGFNFSFFQIGAAWLYSWLAQLEFPKFTIADRTHFRSFSFFTEYQAWRVPSDVENSASIYLDKFIIGVRIYIL
jgi:hypothetical protein